MDMATSDARLQRRVQIVEDHLRFENEKDIAGTVGTFGAQARFDDEPWADRRLGKGGVESYYTEMMTATNDFQITVNKRYVSEDAVILEATLAGTHTGAWRGLPATGRSFSFELCAVFTFDDDDKILGEKIFYDRATVLRQFGVYREPTTALGGLMVAVNHPVTLTLALLRSLFKR